MKKDTELFLFEQDGKWYCFFVADLYRHVFSANGVVKNNKNPFGGSKLTKNTVRRLRRAQKSASFGFPTKSLMLTSSGDIEPVNEAYNNNLFFRKTKPSGSELYIAKILEKNPLPNVVTIYKATEDYIDMELLDIDADINPNQLIKARQQLLSLGIVYLDWKRDNVGVDRNGVTKVFDFNASGLVDENGKWELPGPKGYIYRRAVKAGMKTPIDIDQWAFNHFV